MKAEGRHLCLVTAFALDRYVQQCAEVAMDSGEEDQEGYTHSTTNLPKFDAGAIAGDWRTIPVTFTNTVFDLQLRGESTDRRISNVFEYSSSPPDYGEGFEERQYGYALLGLDAYEVSNSLRRHAGIPIRPAEEWPVGKMKEQKQKTEQMRLEREQRYAKNDA